MCDCVLHVINHNFYLKAKITYMVQYPHTDESEAGSVHVHAAVAAVVRLHLDGHSLTAWFESEISEKKDNEMFYTVLFICRNSHVKSEVPNLPLKVYLRCIQCYVD